jgi:hypothetical protein
MIECFEEEPIVTVDEPVKTDNNNTGLTSGQIALIVLAVISVVILIVTVSYFYLPQIYKDYKAKKILKEQTIASNQTLANLLIIDKNPLDKVVGHAG